jgi:activator of HSP90 ATPase
LKTAVIKQKVLIDADPGSVFEAYVNPTRHADFTGSPASGKGEVGGTFTAWDGYITGKYVELVKGEKVVHEWTTTGWPDGAPASMVEITLKKVGKKTEFTMVHTKVPAEQAKDYEQGWTDYYWEPLKKYFAKS